MLEVYEEAAGGGYLPIPKWPRHMPSTTKMFSVLSTKNAISSLSTYEIENRRFSNSRLRHVTEGLATSSHQTPWAITLFEEATIYPFSFNSQGERNVFFAYLYGHV